MGRGRSGGSRDNPSGAVTGLRRESSAGKSSSERRGWKRLENVCKHRREGGGTW